MKLGISTYSLYKAFKAGEMTVQDIIETIADLGAEHVEIVPLDYSLDTNPEYIERIKEVASKRNIELSNYAIAANFSDLDEQQFQTELARVKREVDICAKLGIKKMRHDIGFSTNISVEHFEAEFDSFVKAATEIADYAAQYGITTSIENHGFYVQHSERVRRIVHAVNRPNFKLTVDVGNFLCVGEAPSVAVANTISYASMVHVKDFYIRDEMAVTDGWFKSASGQWLRGAILGQGDIDLVKALKLVKESGYDEYISLEFEGMEDCINGTRLGFEFLKKAWQTL